MTALINASQHYPMEYNINIRHPPIYTIVDIRAHNHLFMCVTAGVIGRTRKVSFLVNFAKHSLVVRKQFANSIFAFRFSHFRIGLRDTIYNIEVLTCTDTRDQNDHREMTLGRLRVCLASELATPLRVIRFPLVGCQEGFVFRTKKTHTLKAYANVVRSLLVVYQLYRLTALVTVRSQGTRTRLGRRRRLL